MARLDASAGQWTALADELDAWAGSGHRATLWWRDDDATGPGPMLDRLLDVAGDTPICLAVIPMKARESLADRMNAHIAEGGATVALQHGYAHTNNATPPKKAEFGPHRPLDVMVAELGEARQRMEAMFGPLFRPVMTPPWNNIAEDLIPLLRQAGLTGLSRLGPRKANEGPDVVNVHVDIIDWKRRGFAGAPASLGQLIDHLAARRKGEAETGEATGVMTHHRVHDKYCWDFLARLNDVIRKHPAAQWTMGPGEPWEAVR